MRDTAEMGNQTAGLEFPTHLDRPVFPSLVGAPGQVVEYGEVFRRVPQRKRAAGRPVPFEMTVQDDGEGAGALADTFMVTGVRIRRGRGPVAGNIQVR